MSLPRNVAPDQRIRDIKHGVRARIMRGAFSLIELLVAIAIIGILIALFSPAVQRARDASARTLCTNNLRQIGVALHQYEIARKRFPPGVGYPDSFPFMSWHARVLPFIEQNSLWQQTVSAYQADKAFWDNPPHVGFATKIPLFQCPADGIAETLADFHGRPAARTSYFGVEGTNQFLQDGLLYLNSRVRVLDIKDGTSNTLLVGERGASSMESRFGWWYAGTGLNLNGSADMVLGVREIGFGTSPPIGCGRGPYHFGPGRSDNPCDILHFWSMHAGNGANFLFADGSIRFLPYHAEPMMPAMATRAGNESVAVPD
jgi:prepilin-type N-terminal cleavage/methylation domain-containing protein/prepilin-type processing-associated H-X9-DG protein